MENEPKMIRQQMAATRTALTDKLAIFEQRAVDTMEDVSMAVTETVGNVQENVEETVRTVREFVQETVETVKDVCDLERQVDQRPWTMMAGATALGFLGGQLLCDRRAGHGTGSAQRTTSATDEPSWLAALSDTFQPELTQLKGLAVEMLLSIVRDVVTQSMPKPRDRQGEDVTNGITVNPERGRYLW